MFHDSSASHTHKINLVIARFMVLHVVMHLFHLFRQTYRKNVSRRGKGSARQGSQQNKMRTTYSEGRCNAVASFKGHDSTSNLRVAVKVSKKASYKAIV